MKIIVWFPERTYHLKNSLPISPYTQHHLLCEDQPFGVAVSFHLPLNPFCSTLLYGYLLTCPFEQKSGIFDMLCRNGGFNLFMYFLATVNCCCSGLSVVVEVWGYSLAVVHRLSLW